MPAPCAFGISTAFTGGGKYVPEDIRFQILYRLFFRSVSNSSIDSPSTPGAPLFAFTFCHASQHLPLRDLERLAWCFQLVHATPPGITRLTERTQPRTTRPLRSARHYSGLHHYYGPVRQRAAATVLSASRFRPLGTLPLAAHFQGGRSIGARLLHVPHESRRPGSRHLCAGHRLASQRATARLIPGQAVTARFRCQTWGNADGTVSRAPGVRPPHVSSALWRR